jgi:hypothetical protein
MKFRAVARWAATLALLPAAIAVIVALVLTDLPPENGSKLSESLFRQ